MGKTIITVLVVLFVCLIGFMVIDPNVNFGSNIIGGNLNNITSETITVGISGQVQNAGTYIMQSGDTMSTLIDTAGGLTTLADDKCFFLDYEIEDGCTYYIASTNDTGDICSTNYVVKVNINTATLEELMSISGFGSVTSQSVIDYRNQNGEYRCLENIMNVSGIGKSTFEKIKDYICLA